MSYELNVSYADSGGFVQTPIGGVTFENLKAELAKENKLFEVPGDLTSPVDSNLEYVGGSLRQVNQYGDNNKLTCVWDTVTAENYSEYLPAFNFNFATIVNGFASMVGQVSVSDPVYQGNQVFTVNLRIRLDANMNNTVNEYYYIQQGSTRYVKLLSDNHDLKVEVKTDNGSIFSASHTLPDGSAGTEYDVAFTLVNKDGATDGALYLYVDGVMETSQVITDTLNTAFFTDMYFKSQNRVAFKNFQYEPTNKYGGVDYTPKVSLPENRFLEASENVVSDMYTEIGNIVEYIGLGSNVNSLARFTINGMYWTGSVWGGSSNTFATASTLAEISAHIAALPLNDNYSVNVLFGDSLAQGYIDDLTFSFNGQKRVDAASLTTAAAIPMDDVLAFDAIFSVPDIYSSVTWCPYVDSDLYWYDGSKWEKANGSIAQSNPTAELAPEVLAELEAGGSLRWTGFLYQGVDPATGFQNPNSPSITQANITINYALPPITPVQKCTVYTFLRDACTSEGEQCLVVENQASFFHGDITVEKSECEVCPVGNSAIINQGFFETETLNTLATETSQKYMYAFYMRFKQTIQVKGVDTIKNTDEFLGYAEVPDTNEVRLSDLVFVQEKPKNS